MLSALTPIRCFRASGSVSVEVRISAWEGCLKGWQALAPHGMSLGPKQGWDVKGVHPVTGETLTEVTS